MSPQGHGGDRGRPRDGERGAELVRGALSPRPLLRAGLWRGHPAPAERPAGPGKKLSRDLPTGLWPLRNPEWLWLSRDTWFGCAQTQRLAVLRHTVWLSCDTDSGCSGAQRLAVLAT